MNDDITISKHVDRDEMIDVVCDAFERAWKTAKRPVIEEYVTRVDAKSRAELLRQLLAVELEMRRKAGERLAIDEYQSRFADYPTAVKGAFALEQAAQFSPAGGQPEQIERYEIRGTLGKGTYGIVFLAFDPQLQRQVALKIPLFEQIASTSELASGVHEARHAVAVETSGIVKILDIRLEHNPPFIVMDYIDGGSLKDLLAAGSLPPRRAVELLLQVAEALDHTHRKRVFHLDLKPANILLDRQGRAYITDFGFAIRQDHRGRYIGHPTGSPAYMSPEQVRREANKFDGTSDIWSLGIIFYEMLSGQRPFTGSKEQDLREAIIHASPQRLRQLDPGIPEQLERICLKCLSRHQDDRYATAADLVRELRWWQELECCGPPADASPRVETTVETAVPIRPQGLRSFTAEHADFFLSLLPGPRDRYGMPESILFWKRRIESLDLDETFPVGVVFGPSGCGKSSLVSAGLIPRLAASVITIRVICTPDQTELDLLGRLRNRFPALGEDVALPEMIAVLRDETEVRGQARKVLMVFDQFEQWLHSWQSDPQNQLLDALRHCDGCRVQCLLVVRADFFHTLSDFMRQIEVLSREGHNLAGVDLFDKQHALKVLEAFGRGYNKLDEPLANDQREFMRQVVDELATDGKVICVRLSLIAEMMKHRDWTPSTWDSVGRSEGVREAFLEETFNGPSAPPSHREHSEAARYVLEALLPDAGVEIKGQDRSYAELLRASRYEDRPQAFRELLDILDDEVRLITPVESRSGSPDATVSGDHSSPLLESRQYQLTHDYLVPSLRSWLTRKRRETVQGRAELLLSERAAWWSGHHDARFLPTGPEWASIHRWTRRDRWSQAERQLMRRADRRMLWRGLLVAGIVLSAIGLWRWNVRNDRSREAEAWVAKLPGAQIARIPGMVDAVSRSTKLAPYIARHLDQELQSPELRDWERVVFQLARLAVDRDVEQLRPIIDYLVNSSDDHVLAIRESLPFALYQPAADMLWLVANSEHEIPRRRLAAGLALAGLDANNEQWAAIAPQVAGWIAETSTLSLDRLIAGFEPAGTWLKRPLAELVQEKETPVGRAAALALAKFATDDPELLMQIALKADKAALEALLPVLGQHAEFVSSVCQREIRNPPNAPWPDDQSEPRWNPPRAELKDRVAEYGGVLADRFAVCPLLAWNDFDELAAELNEAGYRPTRVRPTYLDDVLYASAVWKRDGADWEFKRSLTRDELLEQDRSFREQAFLPEDLTTHAEATDAAGARTRYACLWVKSPKAEIKTRLSLDRDIDQLIAEQAEADDEGCFAAALDTVETPDGAAERFAVLWKDDPYYPDVPEGGNVLEFGTRYARLEALPWDLAVRASGKPLAEEQGESEPNIVEPDDWKVSTWVDDPRPLQFDCQVAHDGRWSARLSPGEENDVLLQQRVRVDPTATYLFSGWVKTQDVRIVQENGKFGANLSIFSLSQSSGSVYGSSDWTYLSVKFSADRQSEVVVCARLGNSHSACVGTAWFDDLCLVALTEADFSDAIWKDPQFLTSERRAGNLLRNAGFEAPPAAIAWRWLPYWESELTSSADPADFHLRAAQLSHSGYRPISIVTNRARRRAQLRIYAVWARYVGDPTWQDATALRRANAAVILASLSQFGDVMRLFCEDERPSARSYLIERLYLARPNFDQLLKLLASQDEPAVRYGLLLSLRPLLEHVARDEGLIPLQQLLVGWQGRDEDPGVRGAAEWLSKKHFSGSLSSSSSSLEIPVRKNEVASDTNLLHRPHCIDGPEGHVLVAFPEDSRVFLMGNVAAPDNRQSETLHHHRIGRPFAIATKEVTVQQYGRFVVDLAQDGVKVRYDTKYSPTPNCPQNWVTWYEAVMYCRWLGEMEGIEDEQQCYPPLEEIGPRMSLPSDMLQRSGYRLPTEAEWEYACRGGAQTTRWFGEPIDLLPEYACYANNSQARTMAVGELMPNRFGLFDTLGNVREWCHSPFFENRIRYRYQYEDDDSDASVLFSDQSEEGKIPSVVHRGGSFTDFPDELQSAKRIGDPPDERSFIFGFRIARTLKH
ncbi:MAG: protein kinase domain-containing protein [Pirellulaceae bacterium]